MEKRIEKTVFEIMDYVFTKKNSMIYRDLDGDSGVFEYLKIIVDSKIKVLDYEDEDGFNDKLYNEFHNQTIKSLGKYLVKNYNKLGYINEIKNGK